MVELGIPDARKTINALHDKEVAFYERGRSPPALPAVEAYLDIEAQALTDIRHKIERLMP